MKIMIKKGSLTIECACIMSLLLSVMMGSLQLCLFIHNRSWLTSAAHEAAVSGSIEGIRKDGKVEEVVNEKNEDIVNTGFYGIKEVESNINVGKTIEILYESETLSGYGGLKWELEAKGISKVVRPIGWIRKVKAASEVVGGN